MVNPEAWLGDIKCSCLVLLGRRAVVFCLFGASLIAGGCAANTTAVKKDLDPKPFLANAICKAIFSSDSPKSAPKPANGTFPAVPLDETSPTVKISVQECYGRARNHEAIFSARPTNIYPWSNR